MNFNLSQTGSKKFTRNKRESWYKDQAVMELQEERIVLSEELISRLNLEHDNKICMYYTEDSVYLLNVTNNLEVDNKSCFRISKPRSEAGKSEYVNVTYCRNQPEINTMLDEKKGKMSLGMYQAVNFSVNEDGVMYCELQNLNLVEEEHEAVENVDVFQETQMENVID